MENARYFPALDGLRALCVLMVMSNHVPAAVPRPPWIYGYMGVDVFFVLSGFLITTLLIRERQRHGRISLRAFYVRRLLRIVPVYLFTVLLYWLALLATRDAIKMEQFKVALPWLLGFLQEYRPAAAGDVLGHAWTLGIEEKFYLIWPLMLIFVHGLRLRIWLCFAALCVLVTASPYLVARSYGGLLIGAIAAMALFHPACRRLLNSVPSVPDAVLVLLVGAGYVIAGYDPSRVLIFSGSVALLIASLVLRAGLVRRILEHPMLTYIGRRSYAMYLIHVLAMNAVGLMVPWLLPANWFAVMALAYAISLAGAALMSVIIERPGIALGRRLSARIMEHERVQRTVGHTVAAGQ